MKYLYIFLILVISLGTPTETYAVTQSAGLASASSQYFTAVNATSLNPSGNITAEAWVKFTTFNANNAIVSKGDAGTLSGPMILRWSNDNILHLYISDGTGTTDSTVSWTPSTGTWYHVAVTHDTSGNVAFYINGTQQGATQTGAKTALNTADTGKFFIGGYSTTGGSTANSTTLLNGRVMLVRYWSTAESGTTINNNKCVVFGSAQTNMIGEWSLDNVLTDASGNSNTLTNVNTATFTTDVPTCFSATAPKTINGLVKTSIW